MKGANYAAILHFSNVSYSVSSIHHARSICFLRTEEVLWETKISSHANSNIGMGNVDTISCA